MERLALGVNEAAERLGVSREAVIASINRGDLHAVRMGQRILIPVASIEAFLQGAAV